MPKSTLSSVASRLSLTSTAAADAKADKYAFGIEREIVIMKLIDHPNVMNLFDVWETNGELCVGLLPFLPPYTSKRLVLTRSHLLIALDHAAT